MKDTTFPETGIVEPEFMALTEDLNVSAFWQENAVCDRFTLDKPRCALSFSPDDHWLFEFLSVPSTLRYYREKAYRDELHRTANRITLAGVGKAFFDEDTWENEPRRIENLFRCEFAYHEGGTPWFVPVTDDPAAFAAILDEAEATDVTKWALPAPYLKEWEARKEAGKPLPKLGTGSRGPATVMTSVINPEVLFMWCYDEPELVSRFADVLARKMIELNTFFRGFSGNKDRGWWITDDNCSLFNPSLYKEFCYPVLERVLAEMAPGDAWRFQHSDSAMSHLLDQQRALGINAVNYGPTIDVALIREKMPKAYIWGHVPPFLLRNGTAEEIAASVEESFRKAGGTGGLRIATAGSLVAGTGIGRMRWFMKLVQDRCRYTR